MSFITRQLLETDNQGPQPGFSRGGSSSSDGPRASLPVKSASSVRPDPDTGKLGPESFQPGATNLTQLSAEHDRGAASDDIVGKVRPVASSSADNDIDDAAGGLPVISASKLLAKIGSSTEKVVPWRSGPEHRPSRPMAGPRVPALGEVLGKLDAEEVTVRPVLEDDVGEEDWQAGPREGRLWKADRELAEAVQLPEQTWSFEHTIGRGGDKFGPESIHEMRERCEHAFEDTPNTRLRAPAPSTRPEKKEQRKAGPEKAGKGSAPHTEWFMNAPPEEQWWDEWQGEQPQLTVTDAMRELLGAGTRGRGRGAGKGGRGEKPRTIEAGKQWGQREEERQRRMWELSPNIGGKSSEQEGRPPPPRRSEGLPGFKGLKPPGGRSETGLSKLRWEKDVRPCAQTPEGAKPEEARGSPLERRPFRSGRCEPSYCTVDVFREDCWKTFPSSS